MVYLIRCHLRKTNVLILLLFVAVASNALAEDQGETKEITFAHQGRERTFLLHIPATIDRQQASPVIINFHGGGGNARGQQAYSRMDLTAAKYKFIVVYPNGSGAFKQRLLTWNAGTCCGYAMQHKIDDVGFIREIITRLPRYSKIDPQRIYATGMSNGGMMSYRLALELSDKIAAIAPVAGAMHVANFNPKRPIPIMHVHSVDDPRALYHGGLGPAFPLTNQRVEHRDVNEVLEQWAQYNHCQQGPQLYKQVSVTTKDHGTQGAEKWAYTACRQRAEVVHWKLTGAGHVWPGGEQDYMVNILGPGTQVINVNDVMWRFFTEHDLSASVNE
jgi:polyhydroxybutyrate depolymerase